mmetsp:Transcript_13475/g.31147  ORF Transcript_13475/g.31147 Transcript_13475/m.31147 type:complete len:92 (-) Transcript_13475:1625-1900(-)
MVCCVFSFVEKRRDNHVSPECMAIQKCLTYNLVVGVKATVSNPIKKLLEFHGFGLIRVTQMSATFVPVGPVFISGAGWLSPSLEVISKPSR